MKNKLFFIAFFFTLFFQTNVASVWGQEAPELPNHLIINQAAGVGGKTDGALQYSFAELYNPTDATVNLDGWSLQYATNSKGGNVAVWQVLPLVGNIPAKCSYLIRMDGGGDQAATKVFMYKSDLDWNITINNEALMFALVNHTTPLSTTNPLADAGIVDFLGAQNTSGTPPNFFEGSSYAQKFSKQQSARRNNFVDTDDNSLDFTAIDYRNFNGNNMEDPGLLAVRPRSSAEGPWVAGNQTPPFWYNEWMASRGLPPSTSGTIQFSMPAGLYNTPFDLTLSTTAAGAVIRYTLDGTDPTPVSTQYTVPLTMQDRTAEHEVLTQITNIGSYTPPPPGTNFQGTVVKAQLFNTDGVAISDLYVNSYYVSPSLYTRYGDLPVVSISTPMGNFFDTNIGIYTADNYNMSGTDWERPVNVEIFDPKAQNPRERVVSQGMGVRINGGATRSFPQKSLRFYARSGNLTNGMPVLNGKNSIDYDLFQGTVKNVSGNPLTSGFKRFLLRNSGNDAPSSFMRDGVISTLSNNLATNFQGYRPGVAFLNGEFWGLYEIREREDDEYLAQHYGGSNNNYMLLDNPSPLGYPSDYDDAQIAEYTNHYMKLYNDFKNLDMSQSETYDEFLKYVDENSLIDYTIVETFIGNRDWVNQDTRSWETKTRFGNNLLMWRYTGTPTGMPGQDGKYRWILHDLDFGFGLNNDPRDLANYDAITEAINGVKEDGGNGIIFGNSDITFYYFNWLMKNPEFKAKFVNRYMDLLNTCLSPSAVNSVVDDIMSKIECVMKGEQKARWDYTLDYSSWINETNKIKEWAAERASPTGGIIANGLYKYANSQQTAPLTLKSLGSGHIIINGIELTSGNDSWNGIYFVGNTQTLKATANTGHTFKCFLVIENSSGSISIEQSETITINVVAGGNTVYAVYDDATGDNVLGVVGGTNIVRTMYAGETSPLPATVKILYTNGDISDEAVDWSFTLPSESDVYKTLRATGSVAGFSDITMTAEVEVIPKNLVYYIDAGSVGQTSPAYEAVSAKLAKEGKVLRNEVSDKFYNGSGWGFINVDNGVPTYERDMYIGADGVPDRRIDALIADFSDNPYGLKMLTGYAGLNPAGNRLEYRLFLPRGAYEITTGHLSFWNDLYRPMEIYFNDVLVQKEFECGARGEYKVLTNTYIQETDGELVIKVINLADQGGSLSFLFVKAIEKFTVVGGEHIDRVGYVGDALPLPKEVAVESYTGGESHTASVDWGNIPETIAETDAYKILKFTGTVEGCDLTMTASVEVIPHGLVYYIDAGTVGETSPSYEAVKAKLAADNKPPLRNSTSDRFYTNSDPANMRWGFVNEDENGVQTYERDMYHSLNGEPRPVDGLIADFSDNPYGLKMLTGYAGNNPVGNPLEYRLYLTKGEYKITTGHLSFWNDQYRPMEIYFNDVLVQGEFECGARGEYKVWTNAYTQEADGELVIKVINLNDQGGSLSFVCVQAIDEEGYSISSDTRFDTIAYVGDELPLPKEVEVVKFASEQKFTANVVWNYTTPILAADVYKKLQLTGEVVGYNLTISASVEVIPHGLIYYIDAGTVGETSPSYEAVKAKLAEDGQLPLLNEVSDKFYNGTGWGFVNKDENGYTYERDMYRGADGIPDRRIDALIADFSDNPYGLKMLTGYAGANPANNRLEYRMYLPKGKYEITTGHLSFWNDAYRPMEIYFNDALVQEEFECGARGEYKVWTNTYTQQTDGELVIKVINLADQGGSLSFVSVRATEDAFVIDGDTFINCAAYVGDGNPVTKEVNVISYANREKRTAVAEMNYPTPIGIEDIYKTLRLDGTVVNYGLKVTGAVEVIPHDLVYYIDAGTVGQTSPAYDAVSAKLAKEGNALLNGAPDKFYDGSGWGFINIDNGKPTYERDMYIGADGIPDRRIDALVADFSDNPYGLKMLTGYAGENPIGNRLEYRMFLPKGKYNITTGHLSFWNDAYRPMEIYFNDALVQEEFECGARGEYKILTNTYIQETAGELAIKIKNLENEGAALSFLFVQAIEKTPSFTVTFLDYDGSVLKTDVVESGEVTSPPVSSPVREGYIFTGWFEEGSETAFDFNTPITDDITLTARYSEIMPYAQLNIIQVFGGGPNDNSSSVSHSFIELYNPTDAAINLEGWSLQVQNGNENTGTPATEWLMLKFKNIDIIGANSSLLIRLDEVAQSNARYKVDNYDISWISGRLLSNRAFSIALVRTQALLSKNITDEEKAYVVDLVGAKNTGANDVVLNFEGAPFGDMSKQKSVRRIELKKSGDNFHDTDNNSADFMSIDYRKVSGNNGISDEKVAEYRPRWSGDGAWGKYYAVTFDAANGNQAVVVFTEINRFVAEPAKPARDNYRFLDWYNENDKFDFINTPVTADIVLTAKWSLYGDVNTDSSVTPIDATWLSRYLSEWEGVEINLLNADVNDDSRVTPLDLTVLSRFLGEWEGYETLPYKPQTGSASMLMNVSKVSNNIAEAGAPAIRVSNSTGIVGNIVDVPINLENNPGIISLRLHVSYDASKLELVNVIDGTVLGASAHGNNLNKMPYTLYWPDNAYKNDIAVDGEIAVLQFRIKEETAATPIDITYNLADDDIYNFNLQPVTFAVVNGSVTGISQDDADIAAAKLLVEGADYTDTQANVPDEAAALAKIETIIGELYLNGVSTTVNKVSYTAPVAGSVNNEAGNDGNYTFTVTLTKGAGTPQTTGELTLTIIATAFEGFVGGIDSFTAGGLKAHIQQGILYVSGLAQGSIWRVYSLGGALIYQGTAADDKAHITLPERGMYIVQSGKSEVKVVF